MTTAQRTLRPTGVRFSRRSAGMSLVEVMIALVVVAVGVMAVMDSIAPQKSLRDATAADQRINAVVRSFAERIAGARWEDLGTAALPWSQARFFNAPVNATPNHVDFCLPPLSEQAENAQHDLVAQGLLPDNQLTGVANLRVYVEYYRALTIPPGTAVTGLVQTGPGLMDGGSPVPGALAANDAFTTWFASHRGPAALRSSTPARLVRDDDPIAIRILAVWDDAGTAVDANDDGKPDASRYLELFTGRRP